MTTAAPDDPFDDIVAGLELDEPTNITDFSQLETPELLDRYHELTEELLATGETIDPTTRDGRDVHSQRAAAVVELHQRGIL